MESAYYVSRGKTEEADTEKRDYQYRYTSPSAF
jgi:hypothetical protein